jgi:hypothetical protein
MLPITKAMGIMSGAGHGVFDTVGPSLTSADVQH